MPILIRLIFRYALLGLATSLSLLDSPTSTPPIITEHVSPIKELPFLFEEQSKPLIQSIIATTTPTPVKPVLKPIIIKPPKPVAPTPITKPKATTSPIVKKEEAKESDDAIVNIICTEKTTTPYGLATRTTSGSGVIISPSGLVITNAHVGIEIMKSELDQNKNCLIHIANSTYETELLYIPNEWIEKNETFILLGSARNNGEHDFAFLRIIGDDSYQYLKLDSSIVKKNDSIKAIGYPIENIILTPFNRLVRTSDDGQVSDIYTFGETVVDVFTTSAITTAGQGASGGAVTRDDKMIGLIVSVLGNRVNALSLSYITSRLDNIHIDLDEITNKNTTSVKNIFAREKAKSLKELISILE